ncbi:hypothetical protein EVAR_16433_1 [Eumeta japonica]|uniref:Uncharacterized protein n=1 Tax=Eumeta variegata TaxID=151549 RepID=A0A4C1UK66_EUMVA|nr:hypothetical protein EVAR_16433_1 [Eumeta japonica]
MMRGFRIFNACRAAYQNVSDLIPNGYMRQKCTIRSRRPRSTNKTRRSRRVEIQRTAKSLTVVVVHHLSEDLETAPLNVSEENVYQESLVSRAYCMKTF